MSLTISLINFYRYLLPVRNQFLISLGINPKACKHQETCSAYTIRMIKQHGTIRGIVKGVIRVANCR